MIKIDNLTFYKTCDACPEQYEVRDENDKEVGYVRLRWGYLRVDYPCCGGETIYDAYMDDWWAGCFMSEKERMEHLTKIARAIRERMKQ